MINLPKTSSLKLSLIAVLFIAGSIAPRFSFAQTTNQPTFNHAAICATNLKKTAKFYETVMQLQVIPNPFHDTTHVWLKIGQGLALHIIQGNCTVPTHQIAIHTCFSVPSLEGFMKHLDALNVTYGNWNGEPKKTQLRADGVTQIYLQDPDGNWIEVNNAK